MAMLFERKKPSYKTCKIGFKHIWYTVPVTFHCAIFFSVKQSCYSNIFIRTILFSATILQVPWNNILPSKEEDTAVCYALRFSWKHYGLLSKQPYVFVGLTSRRSCCIYLPPHRSQPSKGSSSIINLGQWLKHACTCCSSSFSSQSWFPRFCELLQTKLCTKLPSFSWLIFFGFVGAFKTGSDVVVLHSASDPKTRSLLSQITDTGLGTLTPTG